MRRGHLSWRRVGPIAGVALFLALSAVALKTWRDLRPLPETLVPGVADVHRPQVLDRSGLPLTVTYQNRWNVHDRVPLHAIPEFLQRVFIESEDRRFYAHHGVDWRARMHALVQNAVAGRGRRGASTITEQVVRILHPRPRTLWSRWLEGIEAVQLEVRFPKAAILEFYLNQVPYARQRRGVAQAARDYFDRELDTLNLKEVLALAVLVRAPSGYDLRRGADAIAQPLAQLAGRLRDRGVITPVQYAEIEGKELQLGSADLPAHADHYVRHVLAQAPSADEAGSGRLRTTLDASLQGRAQRILDRRLHDLASRRVHDGAILIVDHASNEVLAWVNGGRDAPDASGAHIDAVTTPRQPGSALKPFLYALALERGWTAATLIDDAPLAQAVGAGLHSFHNYSRRYYGPVRLREALGNSLNIPAVRTIGFVGREPFLARLHALGIASLAQPADFYGDGLALGNGEVSLYELVRAYAALARQGVYQPLRVTYGADAAADATRRVYHEEVASLIANILSDPQARALEFGGGNLLRFPVQTAVKTGTSTDYRDAWAVGFSHRYTVGVWMGNLDRRPMQEVTGSIGPALVLRALFAELYRNTESAPLYLSRRLRAVPVCRESGERPAPACPTVHEWFAPTQAPRGVCPLHQTGMQIAQSGKVSPRVRATHAQLHLQQPSAGLQLAMDPRIPDELEAFPFALPAEVRADKVEWVVDGGVAGTTVAPRFLWPLARGTHRVHARVWFAPDAAPVDTPEVAFVVK